MKTMIAAVITLALVSTLQANDNLQTSIIQQNEADEQTINDEKLSELYSKMFKSGLLESDLMIENPSRKTMVSVYKYGVQMGRVDPESGTFLEIANVSDQGIQTVPVKPIDTPTASTFLMSNDGVIGYLDDDGRRYDKKGNFVAQNIRAKAENYDIHYVTTYSGINFTGTRTTYAAAVITGKVPMWSDRRKFKSIVLGPGVGGTFNRVGGGYYTLKYPASAKAQYITDVGTTASSREYESFSFSNAPAASKSKFCGWLYKNANYTGDALPVYDDQNINLSNFEGWDNNVESIALNTGISTCEGIGAIVHPSIEQDINQRKLWLGFGKSDHIDFRNNLTIITSKGEVDTAAIADLGSVDEENVSGDDVKKVLAEVARQKKFGRTWACAYRNEVCDLPVANAGNVSAAFTAAVCSYYFGSGVTAAVVAAGTETGSGGIATAVSALIGSWSAKQIAQGAVCLGVLVGSRGAVNATCETVAVEACTPDP